MYNVSHGQPTNNSWGDKHIHSVFLSFNEQHFSCLEDVCMHSCHKGSTQPKLVIFNLSETSAAVLYSSIMEVNNFLQVNQHLLSTRFTILHREFCFVQMVHDTVWWYYAAAEEVNRLLCGVVQHLQNNSDIVWVVMGALESDHSRERLVKLAAKFSFWLRQQSTHNKLHLHTKQWQLSFDCSASQLKWCQNSNPLK